MARALTIPEEDGAYVPVKYNCEHIFKRPQFEGRVNMVQKFANGTIKKNKDGTAMTEETICKKGTMNPELKTKHNL